MKKKEKQQNKIKIFTVIRGTFGGYRRHLFLLVALGIFGAILEGVGINAVIPLFSFLLGDVVPTSADFITNIIRQLFEFLNIPFSFKFLLVFIAVLFLLRAVVITLFTYIRARITASFMFREMNILLTDTLQAKWRFLSKQKTGYLQNTLFWDVRQSTGLLDTVAQFIQSSTGFIIYLFIALSISSTITLITLATGIIMLFILRPLVRKTMVLGEEKSSFEKSFANYLIEHIGGLKVVKSSGIGQKVIKAGRAILEPLRMVYIKSAVMHSLGSAAIQPFSIIFVLILFAFAYKTSSFNLAAFMVVMYLIQKIFVYLQSIQSSLHSIADMTPFASNILKLKSLLRENKDEVINNNKKSFVYKKSLSFRNVSFSYQPETLILSQTSFHVPKNSFLGIIGPSGGGKTSIVDLMLRLFLPDQGNILLDDIPIQDINIDEWRQRISYVPQDIFLMNASIRDNIRFYDETITDDIIYDVARKAHIYDHIISLEKSFDTVVGERGLTLSVGQRQRIVIARALAREPEIIILDEATSALDSESELAIKKTIEDIRKTMTLIVIAHRVSTITNADNILVLKEGAITEYGKPQEMLSNPNSYLARMVRLQHHMK